MLRIQFFVWVSVFLGLVTSCIDETVELQGVVTEDGPSSQVSASNVRVAVHAADGTYFSEATTDENGLFRAQCTER